MKCPDGKLLAAVTPRKSILYSSLLLAGLAVSANAQATVTPLPDGSVLMFQAGTTTSGTGPSGTPTTVVSGGSYFGMDQNGDSQIEPGEKTPLAPFYGVVTGTLTTATNSHTGAPDGSENPGIDLPWSFFSNTGMDFVKTPVALLSGTAPNFTLNFSGWNVTWNGIAAINMGTGAWHPLNCSQIGCTGQTFSNGVANLTWNGVGGGSFVLTYAATVPAGDPSGFGGVRYYLYLTGTVIVPQAMSCSNGSACSVSPMTGFTSTRIGDSDLATAGIPLDPDTNYHYPLHLYYDFTVPAGTGVANVVIPMASPLPANAVYRLYKGGNWQNFTVDAINAVQSAPGTPGTCPAAGDPSYTTGLTQGDYCVELTISDGGVDDTDNSGTTISDPGGIATSTAPAGATTDTRTSGTSGCSISPTPVNPLKRGDWWILLGFVAWLGLWRRKRRS